MRGEKKVRTFTGSVVTFIFGMLIVSFAIMKMDHLLNRRNPTLIANKETIESGRVLQTGQDNFIIAFAAEHWESGPKDDPKYI